MLRTAVRISLACLLSIPSLSFAADSTAFVVDALKSVKWGQYMAQNCEAVTAEGWEGYQTQLCTYESYSGFGPLQVILLNPSNDRMADWLLTACDDAKAMFPLHCAERLALRIKCQSGNQFPVAGLVDEGLLYVFRDGVTVRLKEFPKLTLSKRPTKDQQSIALSSGTVSEVKEFARVQGTTRAEYSQFKGIDAATLQGLSWRKEILDAYQRAWNSPRNELMSAWAKANIKLIDHKHEPAKYFDSYCKQVANSWNSWPIKGE